MNTHEDIIAVLFADPRVTEVHVKAFGDPIIVERRAGRDVVDHGQGLGVDPENVYALLRWLGDPERAGDAEPLKIEVQGASFFVEQLATSVVVRRRPSIEER